MKLFFLLLSFFLSEKAAAAWIESDVSRFLPDKLRQEVLAPTAYPAFWWNTLWIKNGAQDGISEKSQELCRRMRAAPSPHVQRIECLQEASDYLPLVKEWVKALPLRENFPGVEKLSAKLRANLAMAFLDSRSSEFEIMRHDPLRSWENFARRIQDRFDSEGGMTLLPGSRDLLIPILFSQNASDASRFHELISSWEREAESLQLQVALIGPHNAARSNQAQVISDLSLVSYLSLPVFFILALLLWCRRRGAYFLLLLIPLFSVVLAAGLLILFQGSVHALTLSFGGGLIGLGLDYGIHAAFSSNQQKVWRSNRIGLLTTLTALLCLSASKIPLLSEMMIFASLGLICSYLLYRSLFYFSASAFKMKAFSLVPRFRGFATLSIIFALCTLLLPLSRVDLSLGQFEFKSSNQKEAENSLWKHLPNQMPFYWIHESAEDALLQSSKIHSIAGTVGAEAQTLGDLIGNARDFQSNLQSWKAGCQELLPRLSPQLKNLFDPFLQSACASVFFQDTSLSLEEVIKELPLLTGTLLSKNQAISLIVFPGGNSQEGISIVRDTLPAFQSLREVVSVFPRILSQDLSRLLPLVFILNFLILAFHYRRLLPILTSFLPFLSGLGAALLAHLLLGEAFSFVSLMAAVLLFGLSLDYGIFATDSAVRDIAVRDQDLETTLLLNAATTVCGFLPLIFCEHPVLKHLGITLFFGSLATYLSATTAVPALLKSKFFRLRGQNEA